MSTANVVESEPTRVLPSGRLVVVRTTADGEELEVRVPDGRVEVHIVLTAAGPVVRLTAARLELASADTVAVRCRRFDVDASEGVRLASGGGVEITGQELRVRTRDDIHMNGDVIRLNCDPPSSAE